jgi:hypothetical protein
LYINLYFLTNFFILILNFFLKKINQIVIMRIFIPLESHNFLIAVTHKFAGYSTYLLFKINKFDWFYFECIFFFTWYINNKTFIL